MIELEKKYDKILVLDYGSQYNQLITRRIREFGVFSELKSRKMTIDEIKDYAPKAIILSGGPKSVYADDAFTIDPEIFKLGIPILGVCYGMQLMAYVLPGGKVLPNNGNGEFGQAALHFDENSLLFANTPEGQKVLMSHGDSVEAVPKGFVVAARTDKTKIAAIANYDKKLYGAQFHAETTLSEYGNQILKNFVFKIAQCQANWQMKDFINDQIEKIRTEVGNKKVLLGLSGGVDSSVVAVLLHKAIGRQLTCIFVDHGLLRKNEAKLVMESLAGKFGLNIIKVDAQKRFLDKLEGISEPEQKRKIIGKEFIETFNDEAKKLDGIDFLAQGTLYTDVIESGTDTAQTIKSHHNVGGLPKEMHFKLIEPLRTLFKDEVRKLGEEMQMPHALVWRQPFPGPGLAIRILGEITEEKLAVVRDSDAILRDEIAKAGLEDSVWQYFTILTGLRSVGVMGDGRTYDWTIAIRAITSVDGMTADFAKLPWDLLGKISERIVNEVGHINRVVYDITSKPPATIEWE
ncbi:glutamine-hydrolyzing GMP synthase [Oenococcus oeni]|nr:glutamine-hydrolyzing GMP synthase [Oenococcus oeni]TEU58306.1 glutamine-hydrolyzing GMP synthase [Oenococcus oeni]TEU60676.1 glutamine-hydrolyzing GMP synthase [Oenococcus oeni]